jgi:hypothetical protein
MDSIAQMHCTSSNMLKEVQFEVQAAAAAQVFFFVFFQLRGLTHADYSNRRRYCLELRDQINKARAEKLNERSAEVCQHVHWFALKTFCRPSEKVVICVKTSI